MMGMPIHSRSVWSVRVAGSAWAASAVLVLAAVLVVILWLPASAARAADVEANPAEPLSSLSAADQTSASPQPLAAGTLASGTMSCRSSPGCGIARRSAASYISSTAPRRANR